MTVHGQVGTTKTADIVLSSLQNLLIVSVRNNSLVQLLWKQLFVRSDTRRYTGEASTYDDVKFISI